MSVAFKRLILSSLGSMSVQMLSKLKGSCSKKDEMLNAIFIMTKNTILRNFHIFSDTLFASTVHM